MPPTLDIGAFEWRATAPGIVSEGYARAIDVDTHAHSHPHAIGDTSSCTRTG
ncbi:hypothetical protein GCM10009628_43260 [Paeniglutamicibacter kerguelensis]